jgi:hypothetical protein
MVKKRMAMRMVTIFMALIVCGMFFPGLARGEDPNVNAVLTEGGNAALNVDIGDVVLGDQKITSVGITNQSTTSTYTVTLLLNSDADCPNEFTHNADPIVTNFEPGAILNVDVMFTPSDLGACSAELQIAYYGSAGGLVEINFTGNGIEEAPDSFGPVLIGKFATTVTDRLIPTDGTTPSTLQEMVDECDDDSDRRGEFVSCVARATGELMRAGLVKRDERRELVRYATRLEWEMIIQKMRAHKRSHRGVGPWWWVHRR